MPVVVETFHSERLAQNPLGDPPERRVPVYLPPDYEAAAHRRYPLVFALAGFTGTGQSYLNYDFHQPNLPQLLDALIASGALDPCVVVMVDGMTRLGGNQYVDSSAVGPWATHVCEELVPWAEARYRCLGGRAHRGVFGKSSGGYGALMMGLEHADTFAAVACHSGDAYFEYCYGPDIPKAVTGLRRVGGLTKWLETWRDYDKLPGALFATVNIVAMSAFYSPDPSARHGFELPFDEATGVLRPEVFARWKRRDPVELVAAHADALRSLSLLFFDCGERDEYHLQHGARILHGRLDAASVSHVYEAFDDDHRRVSYRYKASLPRLVKAII